jgi:hypothetical protein
MVLAVAIAVLPVLFTATWECRREQDGNTGSAATPTTVPFDHLSDGELSSRAAA